MRKNVPGPRTRLSTLPASLRCAYGDMCRGDLGLMFFLLRMAFWLGVVLILLPSGAAQQNVPSSQVDASDAVSAASATVGDLRNFCTRQPDACTVGSQVAHRTRLQGAGRRKDALRSLDRRAGAARHRIARQRQHRQRSGNGKASLEKASQNTLTPADLRRPGADRRAARTPSPQPDPIAMTQIVRPRRADVHAHGLCGPTPTARRPPAMTPYIRVGHGTALRWRISRRLSRISRSLTTGTIVIAI